MGGSQGERLAESGPGALPTEPGALSQMTLGCFGILGVAILSMENSIDLFSGCGRKIFPCLGGAEQHFHLMQS